MSGTDRPTDGKSPMVALVGPTASGKSAASLAAAEVLRRDHGVAVELISVDSALVYRGMDIGTAKPNLAERTAVPHHLIDILDPSQSYSAADFVADVHRLAKEIASRGAWPLLVGGTMLYVKALAEGLDPLPPADAAVRAELDAWAAREGWPALHAALREVDPITAERLAPNDAQRLQRAWEVFRVSGKPLSAWHSGASTEGQMSDDTSRPGRPDAWPLTPISLEPTDRAWLHARIAQRFDAMLADGFLDEVRTLRARGDLHPQLPSIRCVGYRQAWAMFNGVPSETSEPVQPPAPSASAMAAFREAGIAATRQLAKRQLTWLRSMPNRQIVACDRADAQNQAVERVIAAWRQQHLG